MSKKEELKYRGTPLPDWIRMYHEQFTIRLMMPEEKELLDLITAALKWEKHDTRTPDAGLIEALEKAYGMISVEKGYCPQCGDGSGAYYDNDSNVCQCQWCYETEQIKLVLATHRPNS
jgi:hypothetical protein